MSFQDSWAGSLVKCTNRECNGTWEVQDPYKLEFLAGDGVPDYAAVDHCPLCGSVGAIVRKGPASPEANPNRGG